MNIKSLFAVSAIALASVGAQAVTAPTNLIQNGSFEANTIDPGTWKIFTGTSLVDWQAGKYGVELRNDVSGFAYDGDNFVELDTTRNSSMTQKVSISSPGSYLLSFWYAARPDNVSASKGTDKIEWSFGKGASVVSGTVLENYKVKGATTWTEFFQVFTFSSVQDVYLTFAAAGKSDSYGGSLDKVSLTNITPVPEPESYAMMLAGLGLMATIARRRRKYKV